jgi:hypothetical protein
MISHCKHDFFFTSSNLTSVEYELEDETIGERLERAQVQKVAFNEKTSTQRQFLPKNW